MKLTINIPSRRRPQELTEVVQSLLETIEQPNTTVMVSLDDDDPETIAAAEKLDVIISVAPRPDSIAEKWNRAITVAPADVYLPAVDSAPMITKGFDTKIIEAAKLFPDGIGCVFFTTTNGAFAPLQCPTAGLVEKLGYIYPPYFPFWFIDHWMDDICKMIDRMIVVDIKVNAKPHLTRGCRDVAFWATFFEAGQLHRRALAHSILMSDDFLDEPWRKEMIKTRYSMIEAVSMIISGNTRNTAAGIEAIAGGLENEYDARYSRIIERAKSMMVGNDEKAA